MGLYTLHSGKLTAQISDIGGELCSLTVDRHQLIWQGDPDIWAGSAPLLFPFCGRVKEGIYRYDGQDYPMPIHGFLPNSELTVASHSESRLILTLSDTPATRAIYPFSFTLTLDYTLAEGGLTLDVSIAAGDSSLPFSFGAHPGFILPFDGIGFGDAALRFPQGVPLRRIEITSAGLLGEGRRDYPLADSTLPLSHDPAGGCGIFFEIPAERRQVMLTASALPCDIGMNFADFPVLGLWHAEGAPYLCIEPWQGLPAPDGIPTDLTGKPGSLLLSPYQTKRFSLAISISPKGSCHV